MNVYAGTLGQLVIVELFVLWIWFGVLRDTIKERAVSSRASLTTYNKLFLTSLGLVLNAFAITGIMTIRFMELIVPHLIVIWAITAFYILLAIGNFMFILSASIGTNMRLLKVFAAVTLIWTVVVLFVGII